MKSYLIEVISKAETSTVGNRTIHLSNVVESYAVGYHHGINSSVNLDHYHVYLNEVL